MNGQLTSLGFLLIKKTGSFVVFMFSKLLLSAMVANWYVFQMLSAGADPLPLY